MRDNIPPHIPRPLTVEELIKILVEELKQREEVALWEQHEEEVLLEIKENKEKITCYDFINKKIIK
jgi:hypothetical protein